MTANEPDTSGTKPACDAASRLRSKALRGSAWTFGSYAVGNVLRLGSNLILAYVLFPEAFALTALAGIVLQALSMFSDIGIVPAIVQSSRRDEAFLNTAWTLQVLRGFLLWLASFALAWPLAKFYGSPELLWVIPACGLSSIVTGFQSTALHLRLREIDLGAITALTAGEMVVKTMATVAWALIWPSVWAMIGGALISYTLFTIATHTILRGARNRFAWDSAAASQLLRFGGWVFLSTSVTFMAIQADRLILGKLVPMDVLGVYSIAYMFSRLPAEIATRLASQVQFPALAEVFRKDPSRVEAKLLESRRLILAVSQFGTIGIIVLSPWFFTLLYDSRYVDAAVFAPLLAGSAWLALLQASADRCLLAAGDSRSLAFSNLLNALVTIPACIIGHGLCGMPGFIAGVGLGNVAGHAWIVRALAKRGVRIHAQDAAYTGLVGAVAAIVIGFPLVFPLLAGSIHARVALGTAGVIISAWCLFQIAAPLLEGHFRRLRRRMFSGRSTTEASTGAPG